MYLNSLLATIFTPFALLLLTAPFNLLSSPSSSSSLVNAQSTSSGTINLYKDDLGFYIYAYNTPNNSDASDDTPNANGIPMMIGLYTSKTAFMTNCLNFSNYSCNSPICEPIQTSQARQDYPYFKAKGYEASTYLYLGSDYWILSDFALIATSCQSNTSTTFGSSRYGILGMGFWMDNAWNFRNGITFAVPIAPDLSSAELNFLQPTTQINREQVTQALIADENWWIQHENGSLIQMGDFNITTNFTFFFDLGADTIGFPHSLFEPLMDYYREEVFLACTHAFIRPQCTYNDSIENLPNITITIQNSTFVIPPSVYIQNASSITGVADSVTLNLRAVGQHLTGDSYAMQNSMNNIIFDINFMSYYYVVFNVTQEGAGLITLYQNQEIPSPENNSYALYIIFGCIGMIILMTIAYCVFRCFYKKKKGLQSQGRSSRVHQTIVQEALNMDSNVQSVLLAHHSNELKVDKVE